MTAGTFVASARSGGWHRCAAIRFPPEGNRRSSAALLGLGGNAAAAAAVAAVAGLVQLVGSEADEGLGRHQLLDDRGVAAGVDVVDDLGALVTEPAVVLEPDGTFHGAEPTRRRGTGTASTRGRAIPVAVRRLVRTEGCVPRGASGGTRSRAPLRRWLAGIRQLVQPAG